MTAYINDTTGLQLYLSRLFLIKSLPEPRFYCHYPAHVYVRVRIRMLHWCGCLGNASSVTGAPTNTEYQGIVLMKMTLFKWQQSRW